MTRRCPSELALETYLLDPKRSEIAEHVAGCPLCDARLERMRAEGEDFRLHVLPGTLGAIEEAAARPPWWRRPIFLAPIPVAALAALLLLVRPGKPPDDYVGVKGGAGEVGLVLFTAGPTGVAAVGDGAAVFARAQLRFRIRAAPGCNLWIASIDAAGVVSRLFPAAGDGSVQVAAGEQDLPGGAILDGRLGPERLYAVCTPHALPWSELEAGLRRTSVRPGSVRAPAPPALPVGATWTSILLEKRP